MKFNLLTPTQQDILDIFSSWPAWIIFDACKIMVMQQLLYQKLNAQVVNQQ
jgi:hypothetical protein